MQNIEQHELRRPDAVPVSRARRLSLLARANAADIRRMLGTAVDDLDIRPVRGPETGLVMLRGRIGGGGNAFNLGEATVTRASVRLPDGTIGHGQRLGTDHEATRLSAIADALAEAGGHDEGIAALIEITAARLDAERQTLAAETEATRVDFFTLVRGED